MSGRNRLPSGAPRKASQKRSRPAAAPVTAAPMIVWQRGANVRWQGRDGVFHRDVGDGEHGEIGLADRTYRVRLKDLA